MFTIKHNECVGFESRWKVKKVYSVSSTQTTESSQTNMSTSTNDKVSVEIQTAAEQATSSTDVDDQKLAEWLKKIYPQVKRELDDVASSRAFKGYRQSLDLSDANCKLDQTIDVASLVQNKEIGSYVSSMSWNSTNKTFAISCTYTHKSWCYHEGYVVIYSLDRDDKIPEAPKNKLTTESCVMVLEFHPVLPAVLAAGLFSGSIIIWNIQNEKEEEIIVKVNGHGDGITELKWINDINAVKSHLLISSSLDGFLTVWNFNNNTSSLTQSEKHQIKSPILPKNLDGERVQKVYRGVLCFDFSKHTPDMFIVGAEGGLVVQCSLLGSTKLSNSSAEVPIVDSTFKYYEAHRGEINTVSFSPNRKDMFLTSASDSEIRIYLIGQEEPAQVIFLKSQLNCICWVPYEENIIAGCGIAGFIEIFELRKAQRIENTTKDKISLKNLTEIQINKAKTNIVAVGTSDGLLQMWRVPWTFFGKSH